MTIRSSAFIALAVLAGVVSAGADEATIVYVAPNGSDANTGASRTAGKNGPLATVNRALEQVRVMRSRGLRNIKIELLAGTYVLSQPITLGPEDSGQDGSPLFIEGTGRASVILTGSRVLQTHARPDPAVIARMPASARVAVQVYDLNQANLTGWRPLTERGIGYTLPSSTFPSELLVSGSPAPMARWPDTGFARITKVTGTEPPGVEVTLSPAPPKTWKAPFEAWAFGYWGNDWADALLRVRVNADGTLNVLSKLPPYGVRAGQRVYLTNLPEALHVPGAWYLDAAAAKVYALPQANGSTAPPELSLTKDLLVLNGVRNVVVRRITLQDSRRDLVRATNVRSVVVENCTLKNAGFSAAEFNSAIRSGVRYCDIVNTGATGVLLSGGDRRTLASSDNFADDNRIVNFSRTYRTRQPAIRIAGVGARVEHNLIHDAPHIAILFGGNNHHIAFNEIYDVVTETRDAGAIYCGRDWTARGTVIEDNFLHDIRGYGGKQGVGIYLDDQASGITVRDNLLVRVSMGVLVGGGVDNVVENNLFVATSPGVHIDERGMNVMKAATVDPNGDLQRALRAVPIDSAAYRSHYPTLAKVLSDGPGIPRRNVIRNNLDVDGKVADFELDAKVSKYQTLVPNWSTTDERSVWNHSVDVQTANRASDFAIADHSVWISKGFAPLDLRGIGPR